MAMLEARRLTSQETTQVEPDSSRWRLVIESLVVQDSTQFLLDLEKNIKLLNYYLLVSPSLHQKIKQDHGLGKSFLLW